jgi:hypothetical protein
MPDPMGDICRVLKRAKLDDSLLFLSHLLAVIRGNTSDPLTEARFKRLQNRPPEFIIHFLAKWLILESEEPNLYDMNWDRYRRLQNLFFQIDDPIVNDPDWAEAETSGFFERLFTQQTSVQEKLTSREFGLALALYRDCGTPRNNTEFDLKTELESVLTMSIEHFMAMGLLTTRLHLATHNRFPVYGTLRPKLFEKAHKDGIKWCRREIWEPFLQQVACTPDEYRNSRSRPGYRVGDLRYLTFEFNPLERYPIIDVGNEHLIAVDPNLTLKRVTRGLFFDLFERRGTAFSNDFGSVFGRLVGELLQSVCQGDSLWFDDEDVKSKTRKEKAKRPKRGDWAFKGSKCTVLFECKSLQPSLKLRHFGSQESIDELRERIVEGLEQVICQGNDMQLGNWASKGLPPAPFLPVLISYGRFFAVRLPGFRNRIRKALEAKDLGGHPFAILSIDEFDTVVRLAEIGLPIDEFFLQASQEQGPAGIIRLLSPKLAGRIVASTYSHARYEDFVSRFVTNATHTKLHT